MLTVFYSSSMADKNSMMYLKSISKKIGKDAKMFDMDRKGIKALFQEITNLNCREYIAIRPLKEYQLNILEILTAEKKLIDIENVFDYKHLPITITAQAVIDTVVKHLDEVKGKNIVVINRSNVVGKPLILGLLDRGATVIAVTKYTQGDIKKYCDIADIVITGTGGKINLSGIDFSNKLVIDLSDETTIKGAIKSLPTVNELKKRVNNIH